MNRRSLILSALAAATGGSTSLADTSPWRAHIVTGGYDGGTLHAGLFIQLADGWKTYWRVPGSGGVPPSLSLSGENLSSFEMLFPFPERFSDEAGETIGYKHEVLFPVLIHAKDEQKPLQVKVSTFAGVCQTICIPVKADADISTDAQQSGSPDTVLIEKWIAKSPQKSKDTLIRTVSAKSGGSGPVLTLASDTAFDDIFVDFLGKNFYAAKPAAVSGGYEIAVAGAKVANDLQGLSARLTYSSQGKALEQIFVIS